MFDFLKGRNNKKPQNEANNVEEQNQEKTTEKQSFFKRLSQGLTKTRSSFSKGLGNLILGSKAIDEELLEQLEEQLLLADVGIDACHDIIKDLTDKVSRKELADPKALLENLKEELKTILKPAEHPLEIEAKPSPYVILMVGVNGAGKTTTIGKLAKRLQGQGKKVMLAAGDTFRAAAIEQLQTWGDRNQIPVIAQQQGSDSASVAYDAFQAAKARKMNVLIVDTAGRLHTQEHLMQELAKVKRVISKLDEQAPHEILLVLDAGNGQNALNQAKQFQKAVAVSGITLTKLDGTAKGGIIFAIAKQLKLPIRFIGVGEAIDDLRSFEAEAFVNALFS